MGVSTIGAVGVALPPPQALYPATIGGQPGGAVGTNRLTLPPGGDFLLPSGTWLVAPGTLSMLQVLDPVSNTWAPYSTQTVNEPISVNSDGTNYRVMNPTGFPIGAIVTNGGTGYTSAPTVSAATGGSQWLAIVGGGIGSINCATASSGKGYAVPPLVNIAAPPTPGVPATAVCAISGGVISGFTITNPGAGYSPSTSVAVNIVPQASDQNFFPSATATPPATANAVATAATSNVGIVTAVLLTNEGNNPANVAPTMTNTGGGGSGLQVTPVMAFTVTGVSISAAGSALPGSSQGPTYMTALGALQTQSSGLTAAAASVTIGAGLMVPRLAQIIGIQSGSTASILTGSALGAVSGIVDGGLYTTVPTGAFLFPQGGGVPPTVAVVVGGANDTVFVQPL